MKTGTQTQTQTTDEERRRTGKLWKTSWRSDLSQRERRRLCRDTSSSDCLLDREQRRSLTRDLTRDRLRRETDGSLRLSGSTLRSRLLGLTLRLSLLDSGLRLLELLDETDSTLRTWTLDLCLRDCLSEGRRLLTQSSGEL